MFIYKYNSPLGEITMTSSDGESLEGLWIDGQTNYLDSLIRRGEALEYSEKGIFDNTARWLDSYFAGGKPSINGLEIAPVGSDFRLEVWRILCGIPYGKTVAYGDIARTIAERRQSELTSNVSYNKSVDNLALKLNDYSINNVAITSPMTTLKISAQAVGGAVGHNPISIIIPCHRVVGKDGNLVGYGGGIELKKKLLALEGIDLTKFHDPKNTKFKQNR